jgi:hypothetical protein
MTNQDRVSKLESLLERIRRNVTLPRAAAAPQVSPVVAKAPSAPLSAPAPKPISQPFAAPEPKPISQPLAAAAPLEIEPATLPPESAPAPPPEPPAVPSPPPAWTAEPSSAVQARPGTLPPEELSEDDLLDVTTLPPAPVAADVSAEIVVSVGTDAPFEDEQPPASSRRSKVAATLDEALAGATELEQDEEREVPVKTPPPESGPQAALPPGLEAPGVPDVDRLEADLLGPPSMGPTAEQLGETIELDEPLGPQLEIDVAVSGGPVPEPERPPEELEVTLPRAPMPSGTYDVSEAPPPLNIEITEAGVEASLPPVDLARPSDAVPTLPVQHSPREELAPERTLRQAHGATDVARVVLAPSSTPKNFVELLDVSLGL